MGQESHVLRELFIELLCNRAVKACFLVKFLQFSHSGFVLVNTRLRRIQVPIARQAQSSDLGVVGGLAESLF